MQSIRVIEDLRQKTLVEKLCDRYNQIYDAYKERGLDLGKLVVEFGPEFDCLIRDGTNVSKVEKLLYYYEGTLKITRRNQ